MTWTHPDDNKTALNDPTFLHPRIEHTATLTRSGNSIVYIGGLQTNENNQISSASMGEILEYNITNSTWVMHKSPVNSTIPSPRRLHTATLSKIARFFVYQIFVLNFIFKFIIVPNTDLIFIYGGSATGMW